MKILIVDDDPEIRDAVALTLTEHGHDVLEAEDGAQGLDVATGHRPDAIVSDGLMPRMDGYQFLKALKSDQKLKATTFIFYTAVYTGEEAIKFGSSLGADGFIAKPKRPDLFWKEFSAILAKKTSGGKDVVQSPGNGSEEEYFRNYSSIIAAQLEAKVRELEQVIDEHNRVKSVLQDSEERYRSLFESNPHPMWVYDIESLSFLAVNDAAIQNYGYSRDEFLSMTIKEIRPPEDIPALQKTLDNVGQGYSQFGSWRHRKKDGTHIDVEITAHILTFCGRPARLILAQDVTEKKRLERVIKAAAVEWRRTFDAITDAICLLDEQGIIRRSNQAMAGLFGKSINEIIGRHCCDIVHGTSHPAEECPYAVTRITKKRASTEMTLSERWYEVTTDPYFDASGKLIGAVHIMSDITGRKQLEDALRAAVVKAEDEKAKSHGILDAVADGITIQNRDFRIEYQNQYLINIFGDRVGEFCYNVYEKKDRQCEGCPVALSFEDGEIHTAVRTVPMKNGIMSFQNTASPIRDSGGNIISAIEVVRDVTERERYREALEASEKRYRDLFENANDAIVLVDSDFRFIDVNKKSEEMTGFSRGELLQMGILDMVDPEQIPASKKEFLKLSSLWGSEKFHGKIRTKQGRWLDVEVSSSAIRKNGKTVGSRDIIRDITDRKRAEKALRANEEILSVYSKELTALNVASNTLMLITNLKDMYQAICDIIYSVFELKMVWLGIIEKGNQDVKAVAYAGEEKGYLSKIQITWDDSPTGMGPTGMAIKTKKSCRSHIDDAAYAPWRGSAVQNGYHASLAVPLIYARDKCIGALNFYSEDPAYFSPDRIKLCEIFANQAAIAIENAMLIEELKETVLERTREIEDANRELQFINRELDVRREEAEAASRSKTDFLANMSHELRTPLNSIMGFSEIMSLGMAGPLTEKQKEFARDINTSANHLLALINDILDLSKIEAGKVELELSYVKPKELVESSLFLFKEKVLKHGIKLDINIDDRIDSIRVDQRKLKQVLINLLSNALKFTPEGGSIRVSATKSPDSDRFLEISVADSGIGISRENQKKLFQPFQQIETSLTRKYAGTGLGLSLCRKFVESHGGKIFVESDVGKGSTFTFTIPIRPETQA